MTVTTNAETRLLRPQPRCLHSRYTADGRCLVCGATDIWAGDEVCGAAKRASD